MRRHGFALFTFVVLVIACIQWGRYMIKYEKLKEIHTATVEACGKAWLKEPITIEELELIDGEDR